MKAIVSLKKDIVKRISRPEFLQIKWLPVFKNNNGTKILPEDDKFKFEWTLFLFIFT